MQAAVFLGEKRIEVQDVPMPEPGPGQIRVRLEGSGICASNVPCWEGRPWFSYPLPAGSPGHEGWGVVDGVGDGVTSLRAGDRVALLSQNAYAQYDLASEKDAVVLPKALEGQPFPGEALACAMNIFRRSEIVKGQRVAIVGIGFLGALLTQLASAAGARVFAISRRKFALDLARRMGASNTLVFDELGEVKARVHELTRGRGCERVIEAVGSQAALDVASALVGERGRLIIAGYHQDEPRRVDMQSWNWRGIDVVNAHERAPEVYVRGMREAVHAVSQGSLELGSLCTHRFSLGELEGAFEAITERPAGVLKAWVQP